MAGEGPAYVDEDQLYSARIANLLNPPDEPAQAPQAQAAPDPRMAVPADEPPNPVLRTRTAQPQPAQASPASATPVPASVTPNGAATGAPKTWADYVRAGLNRGITASDQSQTALTNLQNQPTAASANADLEQKRAAIAGNPLDPTAQEYKPGIGTRIVRGIDAVRRGGVLGVADPGNVGATPYGAPNRQFGIDTARRAAQVSSLDQQMQENSANEKADTDRLGKIATDQRAQATTALDIGKTATGQQSAEDKTESGKQILDLKQQLADQGGVPKTYEQAVIASKDPSLSPAKQKQYGDAATQMQNTEIKKFQYAARASADPYSDKRQSMIDEATQQVKDLQDKYVYDPDTNTYSDPNSPTRTYSPEEYTDMKNSISTKLDASLSKAKLRPLRVRFDAKDAGAGKGAGQAASPAPSAQTATSIADLQAGQNYKGKDGVLYNYLGGPKTDPKSYKKVAQ